MRIRLASMMAAAMLLLPVATAGASLSQSPQPEKKCPSVSFILNHCD